MRLTAKLIVPLSVIAGIAIYAPSLHYGFSQDDFIHLSASQARNAVEVLNFFNPFERFPDIFFYRPLTTQLFFFLHRSLFGLNPQAFHVTILSLHGLNTVLVFLLVKKLTRGITEKYNLVAALDTLLHSTSAVHFLSLYYISASQQIGRTLFLLLSLLAWISYQETKRKLQLFLSLTFFSLALLSKETSVVLPFLLLPIEMIRRKNDQLYTVVKETSIKMVPYLLILFLYAGIRLFGFQSIFSEGDYRLTLSPAEILQNFKWYVLWFFGLPEVLSTYPSLGLASLKQFAADFPLAGVVLVSSIATVASSLLVVILGRLPIRVIVGFGLFALLSLVPVLPLYQHRYPQYLDLALVALLPVVILVLVQGKSIAKTLGIIFVATFLVTQFVSLSLTEKTHWTTHRSQVADFYRALLTSQHPQLPKNTTVVFTGSEQQTKEVSVALAKEYAVRLWYPDVRVKVFYSENTVQAGPGTIVIPLSRY